MIAPARAKVTRHRPPRCHRRPTERDFDRFPIGARIGVAWGIMGRLPGTVIGRTRFRLRVAMDKDIGWDPPRRPSTPSPLTVRPL